LLAKLSTIINLVRPITYIREVMGYDSWNSFLTTPAHPEYSSAHAVLSMAAAETMESVFGNIGSFTDHTYDYMGFAARTYSSFEAIGMGSQPIEIVCRHSLSTLH
jgi:hypothetical protein